MTRNVLLVLFTALGLTGCAVAAPSASPTPAAADETPWQLAVADIGPDGRYSLDAALNLFATAYGPVPGVDAAQNLAGEEIVDRTVAIQAVMGHAAALTAEQRAAIDAYLAPPADAEVITIPPVAQSGSRVVLGALDASARDALEEAATDFRQQIAARVGRDFAGDIKVFWKDVPGPVTKSGGQALADAWSDWPGGVFGDCHIRIFQGAQVGEPIEILSTVAHEVFHCFQLDAFRTPDSYGIEPGWIVEGQAAWVEATLTSGAGCCASHWDAWLEREVPLTGRSYSAIGFYAHLEETGTDPWAVFKPMWDAGADNILAFNQAGANNDVFLDSWASSVLRQPQRGRAWDTTGPGITDGAASPPSLVLRDGGWIDLSAAFFDTSIRMINLDVDAVHFEVDGHARLSDGSLDTTELDDVWFCVEGRDCGKKCDNAEDPPPIAGTIGYVVAVASTGGVEGTVGRATGKTLNKECESPSPSPTRTPPPTPDSDPDACESGCPMSNGDPHIVTIDDDAYDFMAAGEFVLLRSGDGAFELQARQEPYGSSRTVSINTALAMKVGPSRVGIYADTSSQELDVTVDGRPTDVSQPVDVGGGRIIHSGQGVEVSFPDGTRLFAVGEWAYGISVTVIPSPHLRESAVGIMGPVPPDSLGVPALPDGTVLPEASGTGDYHEQLYGPFEDAWRITSETSLFDYAPGTSSDTYTLADFPAVQDIQTMDDFPADQIAQAGEACAGLGNETLTLQCIFDVIVTGDRGFGRVYEQTARIVETGTLPSTGARARVVNLLTENGQPVDVDVYAWTYSDAEMAEVAALVATVPYGQASDWFNPGLIETAWSDQPYTKVTLQRHGEAVDPISPLAATTEFLGPGTVSTIALYAQELFEGQAGAVLQTIYAEHPSYPVPEAPDGRALIVSRASGLLAEDEPPVLFASVGDGCLVHPLSDPSFPSAQPIGNDLVVPPGEHTLTLHNEPAGELPACDSKPVGPGVPINVAAGDRLLLFAYRLPGTAEVTQLALPFAE